MSEYDRKKIDELLSLYILENVKDIYVEGDFDRDFYSWFLSKNGRDDIAVYSIDIVEIPEETITKYNLPTPSNRSKVIALSCELAKEKQLEATVLCIADRDFEDFMPTTTLNPFLVFTDFNSLESYALDSDTVRKFISIGLGRLPVDEQILIPQLFSVLISLFFIRLANEKLHWGMQWVCIDKYISVSRDAITFDFEKYVNALLLKNHRSAFLNNFISEISNLRSNAPKDEKLLIRGHDLINVFHVVAKKLRSRRNYGDVQFFNGAFTSSVGVGSLNKYSLFKKIVDL